jgi:hypothetical protein
VGLHAPTCANAFAGHFEFVRRVDDDDGGNKKNNSSEEDDWDTDPDYEGISHTTIRAKDPEVTIPKQPKQRRGSILIHAPDGEYFTNALRLLKTATDADALQDAPGKKMEAAVHYSLALEMLQVVAERNFKRSRCVLPTILLTSTCLFINYCFMRSNAAGNCKQESLGALATKIEDVTKRLSTLQSQISDMDFKSAKALAASGGGVDLHFEAAVELLAKREGEVAEMEAEESLSRLEQGLLASHKEQIEELKKKLSEAAAAASAAVAAQAAEPEAAPAASKGKGMVPPPPGSAPAAVYYDDFDDLDGSGEAQAEIAVETPAAAAQATASEAAQAASKGKGMAPPPPASAPAAASAQAAEPEAAQAASKWKGMAPPPPASVPAETVYYDDFDDLHGPGEAQAEIAAETPAATSILQAVFTQPGPLGLRFRVTESGSGRTEIVNVNANSQAVQHAQLAVGLLLRSIAADSLGGEAVLVTSYDHGIGMLQSASRPVTLAFDPPEAEMQVHAEQVEQGPAVPQQAAPPCDTTCNDQINTTPTHASGIGYDDAFLGSLPRKASSRMKVLQEKGVLDEGRQGSEALRRQLQDLAASFDFARDTRGGGAKLQQMHELRTQIARLDEGSPRMSLAFKDVAAADGWSSQVTALALARMESTLAESSHALSATDSSGGVRGSMLHGLESSVAEAEHEANANTATIANNGKLLAASQATIDFARTDAQGYDQFGTAASMTGPSMEEAARYIKLEREGAEKADISAALEASRRADIEQQTAQAFHELKQTKAKLVETEFSLARLTEQLQIREELLAERTARAVKTQNEMNEKMVAMQTDLHEVLQSRRVQTAEAANSRVREAEQQAELRLADERHRLQNAETQLKQEVAGRQAAEARADEAVSALAQTRALLGEAELKARRASEELARSVAMLQKSDEALRQVRTDAERSLLNAQMRAREEAESRGKAAAQAAMRVAEQTAQEAAEAVEAEREAKRELLAQVQAERLRVDVAERQAAEAVKAIERLEQAAVEADEALATSRLDTQAAITAAGNAAAKLETEQLSHDDAAKAEARCAAPPQTGGVQLTVGHRTFPVPVAPRSAGPRRPWPRSRGRRHY